jgi:hypothetical protein
MGQIGSLTKRQRPLTSAAEWARSSAVEHLTFNQGVDGSIPSGLTTNSCTSALARRALRMACLAGKALVGLV